MSISFAVIGERRDDPMILVLRGDDGRHYLYDLTRDHIAPVELDTVEPVALFAPPDEPLGWEPVADPPFA